MQSKRNATRRATVNQAKRQKHSLVRIKYICATQLVEKQAKQKKSRFEKEKMKMKMKERKIYLLPSVV